ncbi:MAG: class I SAM-dependent methyltransferase [Candidatus Hydrogenedentota bacterium]
MMADGLHRQAEPEVMDETEEAHAYAVADFAEVNAAFVERLCELSENIPAALALDLGTGPADIPMRVAQAKPDWRIWAADASWAMLEHGREVCKKANVATATGLLLADAKLLPICSRSLDVIFSNSILHHINDTASLWNEIKRVAKPGALIFLRDLARPGSSSDALDIVRKHAGNESKLLREEYYRSLLSAYTVEEIQQQLESAGLDTFEIKQVTDRHLDIWGIMPPPEAANSRGRRRAVTRQA